MKGNDTLLVPFGGNILNPGSFFTLIGYILFDTF